MWMSGLYMPITNSCIHIYIYVLTRHRNTHCVGYRYICCFDGRSDLMKPESGVSSVYGGLLNDAS